MTTTTPIMNGTGAPKNVTSVAGAGLRLALLLNAVACQVANLGVDIHSISKGIALFSTSLKQLGQSLQAEHSVHTQECVDTAHRIGDQARTVFEEVEDMLERVQKAEIEPEQKDVPVQQRFKDCFKKQRVTYLLAQLEALKLSLMVMTQILHLGRLQEVRSVLNTLTDELIVQERADAQNMLIVRYWSTKKLDRLYELARQEAKETQRPAVRFDSDEKRSATPSNTPSLTKLPIIPLGVESSLNSMEESPGDMLRLTEEVLNALLKRWIRIEAGQSMKPIPRAYVSSGSEDGLSDDDSFEHPTHGYYLEGVTTDWRKPHSQEARMQAAQLRKMYSDKQAHVHSDSDGSEDSLVRGEGRPGRRENHRKKQYTSYDDMPEQGQQMDTSTTTPSTSRPYSYSTTNTVPGSDAETHWRHASSWTKPQPIPVPQPMGNTLNVNTGAQPERLASSQPGARGIPSSPSMRHAGPYANGSFSSHYKPQSNGFPPTPSSYTHQPSYYYPPQHQPQPQTQQQQQYRQYNNAPPPRFVRTLSDNQQYLTPPSQQQQQQHRHRSSRNNRSSKGGSSGSSSGGARSPSPYSRHKDLKRTAMRGILGASAIGGFMDALEAFSII